MYEIETMQDFFNAHAKDHEKIAMSLKGADKFYAFTAELLPVEPKANVLDLGVGTGLELERYFEINPKAKLTCIDISVKMLEVLMRKFPKKKIKTKQCSFFDFRYAIDKYDSVVAVQSLHYYTYAQKKRLFKRIFNSLKPNGTFIITDTYAKNEMVEQESLDKLLLVKKINGIPVDFEGYYHHDLPLTLEHEIDALEKCGFKVEVVKTWHKYTSCIKATKIVDEEQ